MGKVIQEFKKIIPEARWIFYSNKNSEFSEDINETVGKQYIERISLVLKQTFDALSEKTLDTFVIYARKYNIFLKAFGNNTFLWAVVEKDKFGADMLIKLKDFTLPEEVSVPPVEEIKKVPVEVEKEPPAVKKTEAPAFPSEILEDFKKVSAKYLGDFAVDIFENVMTDLKIEKDNLTKEILVNLCYGLERSAGMIVGPSKARKLADDLLERIKEEK